MGEIINRAGRIIRDRLLPRKEPKPFVPSSKQMAEVQDTIVRLGRARAINAEELEELSGIAAKFKVTDPKIRVDELPDSERLRNLNDFLVRSGDYGHVNDDTLGSIQHASRLAQRKEDQEREDEQKEGRLITRRGFLNGVLAVTGVSTVCGLGYLATTIDLWKKEPPKPKPYPATTAVLATPMLVPTVISIVETKPTPEATRIPDIQVTERDGWKKVLGREVEVRTLPPSITTKVRGKLESLGLRLMYIPKLDLGSLGDLVTQGEGKYLDGLQFRYPNWRHSETMGRSEVDDISDGPKPRNLQESFWRDVIKGDINFPELPGQWMAVEKMPLTGSSPLTSRLGLKAGVPWIDAKKTISKEKAGILEEIGLGDGTDLRMPEALEWNLIANREGLRQNYLYEWTNTEYRDSYRKGHSGYKEGAYGLFAGNDSFWTGAASIRGSGPDTMGGDFKFRLVVVVKH